MDALFRRSSELPREQRLAYLDEHCKGDDELHAEVASLLEHRLTDDRFLESSLLGTEFHVSKLENAVSPHLQVGQRIGRYRIYDTIASGGMATVYRARQDTPERTVALKVMRSGIAPGDSLRRFRDEAKILARLHHPGVAQIYDVGTHRVDGSALHEVHYLAMEYVAGASHLTAYAEAAELDLRTRLSLFVSICDAVNHGHQRGIIHRDLKPSNILVDSNGNPKVIDFGVARVLNTDLTTLTVRTKLGELVGTLQYMSPEQCDADPHAIDIRSDVYSLGVVLYELLTGALPYDVPSRQIYKATQVIKEAPPRRPSSLRQRITGDVETILLTALAKDPASRYQSAVDLRGDIHRYLHHRTIHARPPSFSYHLAKFVCRHRASTVLGGLLLLTLVAGISGITLSLFEARAQRDTARDVVEFLDGMLAKPYELDDGQQATVVDMLRRASQDLGDSFTGQPEVQVILRRTLGRSFGAVSLYSEARREIESALKMARKVHGHEDSRVVELLVDLAGSHHDLSDLDGAEARLKEALAMQNRRFEANSPEIARTQNYLGLVYLDQGRFQEAGRALEHALDVRRRSLDPDDSSIAQSLFNLAVARQMMGDPESAEPFLLEAIEIHTSRGARASISNCRRFLGQIYSDLGKLDKAAAEVLRALAIYEETHSENHPSIAASLWTLGDIFLGKGEPERAEAHLDRAVGIYAESLGPRHMYTLRTRKKLADSVQLQSKLDEAETLLRRLEEDVRQELGDAHPLAAATLTALAHALHGQGNLTEAARVCAEALSIVRAHPDQRNYRDLALLNILAMIRRESGDPQEALRLIDKALAMHPDLTPNGSYELHLRITQGHTLADLERLDEAKACLLAVCTVAPETKNRQLLKRIRGAMQQLASIFDDAGNAEKARECREVCLAIPR